MGFKRIKGEKAEIGTDQYLQLTVNLKKLRNVTTYKKEKLSRNTKTT